MARFRSDASQLGGTGTSVPGLCTWKGFRASKGEDVSGSAPEGRRMLRKLLLVAACVLACGAMESPAGQVPHRGVPMAGGGGHPSGPRMIPAAPPIGSCRGHNLYAARTWGERECMGSASRDP